MSETRRYGIVGTGMMGVEHIQNLALVPGCDFVAAADPHDMSRRYARQYGGDHIRTYPDYREMMDKETLDAVIIATPNHTHHDIVTGLFDYPVALLIEKPLCTTVEDACDLYELGRAHEQLVWTGLEYRYMPPVTEFIRRVHDRVTGSPHMISIREHRFPFLPKVGDWNRFNANTGGTLVEKCCHFFDLMRHILRDDPVRIFASGGQAVNHLDECYDGQTPDILDHAFVLVDFKGGSRAVLDLCMFAEGAEQQEEIYALGDLGRLDVSIPAADIVWSPRSRAGGYREHVKTDKAALAAGHHHGATFHQLTAFNTALTNGGRPAVTLLDGLRSVQMGAAAHKSIETGQPVTLNFEDEI